MVLIKKLAATTLIVLTISSTACTSAIPVRLELPDQPSYYSDVSKGLTPVYNRAGQIMYYKVTVPALVKLTKNKVMCREDNSTLRAIIKTTH